MSKHLFFNAFKGRVWSKGKKKLVLQSRIGLRRTITAKSSLSESFPAKRDPASQDWSRQLKGIETFGQGLVIMRLG